MPRERNEADGNDVTLPGRAIGEFFDDDQFLIEVANGDDQPAAGF